MSWHGNADETASLYSTDISTARFASDAAWTWLCHFRVDDLTVPRTLVNKGGVDTNVEIYAAVYSDGKFIVTTASTFATIYTGSLTTGNWYVCMVSNDGSASAGGLTASVWDMSGTVLVNAATGDHTSDAGDLTTNVWHGSFGLTYWGLDGDIGHSCYVTTELTQAEAYDYIFDPVGCAQKWQDAYGVEWYVPMVYTTLDACGADWSGNGNNFTDNAAGSATIGDNSPVTLFQSAPEPQGPSTGGGSASGTSVLTLPMLTITSSGVAAHQGTSMPSLPMLTMSAAGVASTAQDGTSAITLPMLTMSASGLGPVTGHGGQWGFGSWW